MNIGYQFLIVLAIAGIISGIGLIYTTLKFKDSFENYKRELLSDIVMTVLPLLCLIAIIYMATH